MNRWSLRFALGACSLVLCAASEHRARACGGCFIRPREATVVTDHRMAFSISPSQSVLWDQIKYSGNPSDFSWVLPVRSGTVVQVSSDAWFAALDAVTQPTITSPNRPCTGGNGCGSSSSSNVAAFGSGGGVADRGVQVISQTVVGPYDTATLRATDPNALEIWLANNGYDLPASMKPTIAAYVAGGFDFIALRLQPGQGVLAMQPVRVVTQGADVTLPLRMVAAGVGAQVGVTLYVVSEGRYEAASPFSNSAIDDSQLVWLQSQGRSNYTELSQSIMKQNGGRTWLTEFAGPMSLVASTGHGCGQVGANFFAYSGVSLGDAYLSQCPCDGGASLDSGFALGMSDAAADAQTGADAPAATDAAEEAFPDAPALEDAQGEASSPEAADAGGDAPSGAAPVCTGDDPGVALVGLDPASTWVTRLRAVLPANTLAEHDLVLQASLNQSRVSNYHTANNYDDPTYSPCGTRSGGCAASASDPGGVPWLEGGALCAIAAAGLRRRRG